MKSLINSKKDWIYRITPVLVIFAVAIVGMHVIEASHAANLRSTSQQVSLGTPTVNINPSSSTSQAKMETLQAHVVQNPSTSLTPNPNFSTDGACAHGVNDNSATCNNNVMAAISHARSVLESLSPLSLNLTDYQNLTVPEQIFVVTNLE